MAARLIAFPRPARHGSRIAAALRRHRVPDALAEALAHDAEGWPGYEPHEALACALAPRMRCAAFDLQKARGILLMGPSGAGKSSVAAKIAAAARGRTVDIIGAIDGLARFRAHPSISPPPGDGLVVMEASGFNPVNRRALSAFAALGAFHGIEAACVVSAMADAQDTADMLAGLRCPRVIVTGLDRTHRLGTLAVAATGPARLAHVTRADGGLDTLEPSALARMLLD